MTKVVIGIDASNIRAGGGLTHLSQLLHATNPSDFQIDRVIVWGGSRTLLKIPNYVWIIKKHVPILDKALPLRILWQQFKLPFLVRREGCHVLFSPGGTLPRFISVSTIVMSQNLLPFEKSEFSRYRLFSLARLRLYLLKISQSMSMRRANGLIFLSQYARKVVLQVVNKSGNGNIAVIPHGIEERFFMKPRKAFPLNHFSKSHPYKILYVSTIDMYKHQWNVAKAVASLRGKGYPVTVEFVGQDFPLALKWLQDTIKELDPSSEYLHYRGALPFEKLHEKYHDSNLFVYASSCENLPNIVLEAMASGLPIACSNRGPMPEVLGDAGIYFDPEDLLDIEGKITTLINDSKLSMELSHKAYERAQKFSWRLSAADTFSFIIKSIKDCE